MLSSFIIGGRGFIFMIVSRYSVPKYSIIELKKGLFAFK